MGVCGGYGRQVTLVLNGTSYLVCRPLTEAEEHHRDLILGLALGLGVGLPLLLVLCCCYGCQGSTAKDDRPRRRDRFVDMRAKGTYSPDLDLAVDVLDSPWVPRPVLERLLDLDPGVHAACMAPSLPPDTLRAMAVGALLRGHAAATGTDVDKAHADLGPALAARAKDGGANGRAADVVAMAAAYLRPAPSPPADMV